MTRPAILASILFFLFLSGCATPEPPTLASQTRRVITGHDPDHKAILIQDGRPVRVMSLDSWKGFEMAELWSTEEPPALPVPPSDPTLTMKSFVPGPGGTRFRVFRLPGRTSRVLDPEALRTEFLSKAPGFTSPKEEKDPAMHSTDTVDYLVVLSGAVSMELDEGRMVDLVPGDCVVQNGTRHAWRNKGEEPCVIAVVMVGATR